MSMPRPWGTTEHKHSTSTAWSKSWCYCLEKVYTYSQTFYHHQTEISSMLCDNKKLYGGILITILSIFMLYMLVLFEYRSTDLHLKSKNRIQTTETIQTCFSSTVLVSHRYDHTYSAPILSLQQIHGGLWQYKGFSFGLWQTAGEWNFWDWHRHYPGGPSHLYKGQWKYLMFVI